jgi:hypothetical protein
MTEMLSISCSSPQAAARPKPTLGLAAFTLVLRRTAKSWNRLRRVERADAVHTAAADL